MRELEMMQASMWTVGLPMAEVQATMAVPVVATQVALATWELVAALVLRVAQAVTLAVRQATTNCALAVAGSLASSDNQVLLWASCGGSAWCCGCVAAAAVTKCLNLLRTTTFFRLRCGQNVVARAWYAHYDVL